ncbi:hypothetical protein BBBOND_0309420 [Babesia bigemina]|uniref:Uncharacterized protein n=1 Tax=Babesia bigemina TaxID=5866 RepID=A0A061DD23_BABBI|nr:hypothetical protein BBBOND_0309420 [Babesia bigemina]CDR97039.1 hypothetical protein BBBOND_0309420 [Babesia bigemina]|eukprot:XP_012769225.1 hypothetical protein BBBOND_0309420 [Babesia bigemina]
MSRGMDWMNCTCGTSCKEYKCKCNCCQQTCKSQEKPGTCSPPAPPPTLSSPGVQDPEASLALSSPPEDEPQENNSHFSPDPQVIAAVIVAIIVAIILLDLCIFRFPVGRNIRDFLVRKIPFCIAFYS